MFFAMVTKWNTLLQNFLVLSSVIGAVWSHARIIDPPGRGSMWRFGFNAPVNFNDAANFCGGYAVQWERNKGKCGVCGDAWDANPRDHEPGGKYALGIIGKTYREGENITIIVDVTANHDGFFEFRLCQNDEKMANVTQKCLDKNRLVIFNNNEEEAVRSRKTIKTALNRYKYFLASSNTGQYSVKTKLPDNLTCKYCVLQWRYHSGNGYGKTTFGKECTGCSKRQEEFYNCADIEIVSKSSPINQPNSNYHLNQDQLNQNQQNDPSSVQNDVFDFYD